MVPPPDTSRPITGLAAGTEVNLARRVFAFVLDVLMLGVPFALLCMAGSFASEAAHQPYSLAYVLAGGIAVGFAVGEAV
jgi:hypothetical protein